MENGCIRLVVKKKGVSENKETEFSDRIQRVNKYRILHRKCDVRVFIHELQNFGKLTRSLRPLVRFPKFCNE